LSSKEKMLDIVEVCKDRKAEEIVVLDVSDVTLIADYFLICHGTSGTHIDAISERVVQSLKESDHTDFHVEGSREEGWVLIDCGDILVHIFTVNQREYYDLERLWGDAEVMSEAETVSGEL